MSDKKKRVIREFCIGILIFVFLAVLSMVLIHYITEEIKASTNASIQTIKEEEFETIWSYVEETQKDAELYLSEVTQEVQDNIKSTCDMDSLKYDMENNIPNDDLNYILKNCLENKYFSKVKNDDNNIYACSKFGILADFSHKASSMRDSENSTWESEISYQYNQELAKNAMHNILTQDTSEIIIVEPEENTKVKDHRQLKVADKDALKDIFINEGIMGLSKYQVLVPAYITSNGDIFGQSDIASGVLIENDKIIIIQKFSIYQQVMNKDKKLLESDKISNIVIRSKTQVMLLQILGLVISISVVIIILYTSSIFNNFILEDSNKKNNTR